MVLQCEDITGILVILQLLNDPRRDDLITEVGPAKLVCLDIYLFFAQVGLGVLLTVI